VLKKCDGTKDVRDGEDGKLGVRGADDIGAEALELYYMAGAGAWV
jgi:hypothetical protein